MSKGNGMEFAKFQELPDSQKLDYLYIEVQNQKSDLRWWVTIFTMVVIAVFEFGKTVFKKYMGV